MSAVQIIAAVVAGRRQKGARAVAERFARPAHHGQRGFARGYDSYFSAVGEKFGGTDESFENEWSNVNGLDRRAQDGERIEAQAGERIVQ